jgi:hypothetical protein
MKLDRFRTPALAATAVLVISGAGIAFAAGPKPAAPQPAAPVVAPATEVQPAGPDTDTLQEGDQTTPDVVAPAAPGALTAPAANPAALKTNAKAAAPKAAAPETAAETAAETTTETEAASDGPGGHADPPGANTDHQFDGEE